MEETKDKILTYIKEEYAKTGFPFFSITILGKLFGEHTRDACNSLYMDGVVKAREGINSKLIEYLIIKP